MNATLSSLVPVLGWALIKFLWQGALVGLIAQIGLMLLRNARPQARYALACTALALCLVLPVAGVSTGFNAATAADVLPSDRWVHLTDTINLGQPSALPTASWQSSVQGQLSWIVALWSIGAALLAARMALGMTWVARAGRSQGEAHPRWQRRLDRLAEKVGVECAIRLRVVADLATPVAAGCWKPVVLVPAALIANMPLDLLEALLAHEVAHIRRHDYLVNLIQSAIEALLFYHPVVWWLSTRIRTEREQIADDIAARALGDPRRLALALHELDLFQEQLQRAGAGEGYLTASLFPAANGGHLMSRIQRLIRPNQHALSWKIAVPIIGFAALCLTVHAHDVTPVATPGVAVAASTSTALAVSALPASPATRPWAPATAVLASVMAASPATPAVAAIPRTPVAKALQIARASADSDDAYAVIRAGREGMRMSGDTRDIPAIERAKRSVHGDFIWVRHDGKTWIVQDPSVLASFEATWAATDGMGKQMDLLGNQMDIPGKHMDELSKQMDALGNRHNPASAEMEALSTQMDALSLRHEALGADMDALGSKMERATDDATREALDRQMKALEQRMKPLEEQTDKLSQSMDEQGKQMEAARKPMEQLGRQMEDAGKPMEELGKQMEQLGKQEEALAHDAERKTQVLIDEAIKNGKAVPADSIRQ